MAGLQSINYPQPNATEADGRLTVSRSSVQISSVLTFASNTVLVVWDVQDNDIMVTFDGSTPTSTNGHRLYVGEKDTWHVNTARAAKFIRAGSADGTLHVSQFNY
jgi:hypothetical protein